MGKYVKQGGNGGKRTGSGRKAAVQKAATKEMRSAARVAGLLPSAILLDNARRFQDLAVAEQERQAKAGAEDMSAREKELREAAINAAAQAGPYFEPKLSAMKVEQAPFDHSKLTDKQLVDLIAILKAGSPSSDAGDGAAPTSH